MKKLTLTIRDCGVCPYCQYDAYYNIGHDSGYDCKKTDKRIVDDGAIKRNRIALEAWEESQDTLFPMPFEDRPVCAFTIPDWCPLEDIDVNS